MVPMSPPHGAPLDATAELLANHPLIRTDDVDDAREQVGRVFCDHRLKATSGSGLDLHLNRYQANTISLHYVDYGATVRIQPGELGSFYLVQMPLGSSARVRCGTNEVESTPRVAAVPNATEDLDMTWHDGAPHLVVYMPRAAVESTIESLTGSPVRAPVRFELGMDMTTPEARVWRSLVETLLVDAQATSPVLNNRMRDQIEDLIALTLVSAQPSNYAAMIERHAHPPTPRAVRRAMDLCEVATDEPLTVSAMAREAGVSVRSLQEGFRQYVGISPMQYLREVRLRNVRNELSAESPAGSVGQVAHRWGFTNLGRFARAYEQRFGERPSETLRMGRRDGAKRLSA